MAPSRNITIGWAASLLLALAMLDASASVEGQESPPQAHAVAATAPSITSANRPLLEQLNTETQALFQQVASSVVRVQLPSGNTIYLGPDDPLAKWRDRIDPQTRLRLEEMLRQAPPNSFIRAEIHPATSPSSTEPSQGTMVFQLTRSIPNSMGVILDDEQHILVSRFVDKTAFGGPVPLVLADGRSALASFVASDRASDLTVLKLMGIKGSAAAFSEGRPREGTLLLVMSLNPAMNRLAVWEGWEPDIAALITTDGKIAGFSRGGQYMSAAACQPAVRDLIEHGFVQRAVLGVAVQVVAADDPQRTADASLGASPALRIVNVFSASAAEKAGLLGGDLILKFAGQSVGDIAALATAIANRRGDTAVVLLRNGHIQTIQVDLQAP